MGQRELAYEIKNFNSGHYYVVTVASEDDKAIKEFDRLALISSDIVRHLITKLEKDRFK
ncbi:30S ribosomal protein S6 [compost metagenome]